MMAWGGACLRPGKAALGLDETDVFLHCVADAGGVPGYVQGIHTLPRVSENNAWYPIGGGGLLL